MSARVGLLRHASRWLAPLLVAATARPLAAQFEVGLGLGVADTDQNAVALVGTITWNVYPPVALRGFVDAELAVPDFKEGLSYVETDRFWIQDENGVLQRPEGDALWQGRGWDAHAALYATYELFWRVHGGAGFAHNGLDATAGMSYLLLVYVTRRTEVGVEFLDAGSFPSGRWRLRLSLGFWHF